MKGKSILFCTSPFCIISISLTKTKCRDQFLMITFCTCYLALVSLYTSHGENVSLDFDLK